MKAIKYNVVISYDGVCAVHGMIFTISEVWIPEKNIIFNCYGPNDCIQFNVFKGKQRSTDNMEDVEVPNETVELMEQYMTIQDKIKNTVINYFLPDTFIEGEENDTED